MPSLPDAIVPLLSPFASLFDARTWRKAQRLLIGAVPAPGRRTVCACLRVLGRQAEPDFVPATRCSTGPAGRRWLSLMWLVRIPWAGRVWTLPFLTVLAPSARYHAEQGQRHKTLTDWARPMLCLLHRWRPSRELVVVANRTYATLRLDAALDAPPRRPGQTGRPRLKGARLPSLRQRLADPQTTWRPLTVRWSPGPGPCHGHGPLGPLRPARRAPVPGAAAGLGRGPRTDGPALHRPAAHPAHDGGLVPAPLAGGSHLPGRAHAPGRGDPTAVGGPRPCPHHARPAGPLGWVTVVAHALLRGRHLVPRRAAWYPKTRPTFADALALVRLTLGTGRPPFHGPDHPPTGKNPRSWSRPNSGSSSATPPEYDRNRP